MHYGGHVAHNFHCVVGKMLEEAINAEVSSHEHFQHTPVLVHPAILGVDICKLIYVTVDVIGFTH